LLRKEHFNELGKNSKLRDHTISNMAFAKSLIKWGGQNSSSVIHGPLGTIFHSIDKANIIAVHTASLL
jgi:hypothetical protein